MKKKKLCQNDYCYLKKYNHQYYKSLESTASRHNTI